jgi:hypothetical protein
MECGQIYFIENQEHFENIPIGIAKNAKVLPFYQKIYGSISLECTL